MDFFKKISELHDEDCENGTAKVGMCPHFVRGDTTKQGGTVQMGVPGNVITEIALEKTIPILLLIDAKEFKKITQ